MTFLARPAVSLSYLTSLCPALLLILAIASPACAQVVVSNLTATGGGTLSVSTTQSVAGAFTTGATTSLLGNVTLALGNASGATSVFTVALYSSNLGLPGTLIETLSGPASPQPVGNYSFTSGGSTTLNPNTTYFWVGTLASPSSSDRRRPLFALSTNETSSDGWAITDFYYVKGSSGTWNATAGNPLMFSVSATSAIPEPSTYAALAGVAALGLAAYRRRRTA